MSKIDKMRRGYVWGAISGLIIAFIVIILFNKPVDVSIKTHLDLDQDLLSRDVNDIVNEIEDTYDDNILSLYIKGISKDELAQEIDKEIAYFNEKGNELVANVIKAGKTFAIENTIAKHSLFTDQIFLIEDNILKNKSEYDYLLSLITHELIHLFQNQRSSVLNALSEAKTVDEIIATLSIIEGHAEYHAENLLNKLNIKIQSGLEFDHNNIAHFKYFYGKRYFSGLKLSDNELWDWYAFKRISIYELIYGLKPIVLNQDVIQEIFNSQFLACSATKLDNPYINSFVYYKTNGFPESNLGLIQGIDLFNLQCEELSGHVAFFTVNDDEIVNLNKNLFDFSMSSIEKNQLTKGLNIIFKSPEKHLIEFENVVGGKKQYTIIYREAVSEFILEVFSQSTMPFSELCSNAIAEEKNIKNKICHYQ